MRILLYSLNFAPEPTGVGKYTGEMAAWLIERGHAVDVICGLPHYPAWNVAPRYRKRGARRESLAGAQVYRAPHYVPSSAAVRSRTRILMEITFTLSAARYWIPILLARSKADVVIAVIPPLQIAVWPRIYNALRGVPCVLHVQDLQVDAALRLNMLDAKWLGRVLYWAERRLLMGATRVATITNAMRQRVISKGVSDSKVWLFPNWANIEHVRPQDRNNEFRQSLVENERTTLVVYAGSMGEKQGLELILDTAEELRNRSDVKFLLVGAGPARARLMRASADRELHNLQFLDVQPVHRLSAMLAAGDIHLVVQRREAADLVMPSKLANILASGRACVVTADRGTVLAATVETNGLGVVVPPENPSALAEAVSALAVDEARRMQYGARARVFAEEHLSRDRIIGSFERKLTELTRETAA